MECPVQNVHDGIVSGSIVESTALAAFDDVLIAHGGTKKVEFSGRRAVDSSFGEEIEAHDHSQCVGVIIKCCPRVRRPRVHPRNEAR